MLIYFTSCQSNAKFWMDGQVFVTPKRINGSQWYFGIDVGVSMWLKKANLDNVLLDIYCQKNLMSL